MREATPFQLYKININVLVDEDKLCFWSIQSLLFKTGRMSAFTMSIISTRDRERLNPFEDISNF